MQQVTKEILTEPNLMLFISTPFCGTCHLAKSMLLDIETIHKQAIFYEMNASLYPQFMQEMEIESVPCLLIKVNDEVKEKVYAFRSIPNIYSYLIKYNKEVFSNPD